LPLPGESRNGSLFRWPGQIALPLLCVIAGARRQMTGRVRRRTSTQPHGRVAGVGVQRW
jgi:hypothetical protein